MPTIAKFCEYRVGRGGRYYRAGRLYRGGQVVVLPEGERPPSGFRTAANEKVQWSDKKKRVLNPTYYGGSDMQTVSAATQDALVRKLVDEHNKSDLMRRAHGLGIDVNGTKHDLAAGIVKAESERGIEPDADAPIDEHVSTTGSAAD